MNKFLNTTYKETVVDIPTLVQRRWGKPGNIYLGLPGAEDLASYYLFFVISFVNVQVFWHVTPL